MHPISFRMDVKYTLHIARLIKLSTIVSLHPVPMKKRQLCVTKQILIQ